MTLPGALTSPQVYPLLQRHYLQVLESRGDSWTLAATNANYILSAEHEGLFQVRGRWHGSTSDDELFSRLRWLISRCNSRHAFPKAYLLPIGPSGHYGLVAEGSLLTGYAPTEAQFFHFLDTILVAAAHLFREADRLFPEIVTWGGDT